MWDGLSPQLQGAIVGGLIGFVSSLVVGVSTLVLSRRLRRSGKLRCQINAWSGGAYGAIRESRTFTVRLLNEKEVGTALWNLRVVFYKNGNPWLSKRPTYTREPPPVDLVDLPPQVTVTQVFQLSFGVPSDAVEGADLTKARESDAIKLVADIPGDGEGAFEEDLPPWGGPDAPA